MPLSSAKTPVLEVVVTSLEDAVEAHAGGANRLEIVADLPSGGLTPPEQLVTAIAEAIPIPCRIMLRTNASMSLSHGTPESKQLELTAQRLAALPTATAFVLGFLATDDKQLDLRTTMKLANLISPKPFTFHRAFDELANPISALEQLSAAIPNLDRILTTGALNDDRNNTWTERANTISKWQHAFPHLTFLMASGPEPNDILQLSDEHNIREIHIGRAARLPATNDGAVTRTRVAAFKQKLLTAASRWT